MQSTLVKFVFKDNIVTEFMQKTGVFESFKVLVAGVVAGKFTMLDGTELNIESIKQSAHAFCETQDYKLIGMVASNGYVWFDEAVKVVSNGETMVPVKDYTKMLESGSNWPRLM